MTDLEVARAMHGAIAEGVWKLTAHEIEQRRFWLAYLHREINRLQQPKAEAPSDRIIDDPRPIQAAQTESEEIGARVDSVKSVKKDPVTKIEPYEENGELAPVTWLRVWKGERLVARLNVAKMAEIKYED